MPIYGNNTFQKGASLTVRGVGTNSTKRNLSAFIQQVLQRKEKSLQLFARRRLQVVNCKPVTRQTCEKRKGESIMTRWNLARCEDNDEVQTFAKKTLLRRKEEQPAVREQAKISLSAEENSNLDSKLSETCF